jgi:hypothetical protein
MIFSTASFDSAKAQIIPPMRGTFLPDTKIYFSYNTCTGLYMTGHVSVQFFEGYDIVEIDVNIAFGD